MKIRVFATAELATVYVAALVESLITREPHPVLGLATGATPILLYRQLVAFHRQGLSLAHVTTINLDEYVGLAPDHPQSYRAFMEAHLFRHVDIPAAQTHVPNGLAPDLAAECARYDALLAAHPIDLQILGIGPNGHIGFNEPEGALKTRTHVVTLTAETLAANARFFPDPAVMPRQAITMGLESILQARAIILMAFGAEKARIVKAALSGEVSTAVPASFLQMHSDVTFVLDEAAASGLGAPVAEASAPLVEHFSR
ncbi:MAG: glucosamine-6-phosphate deaminase [Firmicutes bacterium]|nr:glucosamine-6-phosphate deaminase [Bacillota bacterium]